VRIGLLEHVFSVGGAKHLEVEGCGVGRGNGVGNLVEVVVNNLTEVDESVLLDLHLGDLVDLNTRSMDNTQVTDVVLAVLANDHQLGFPELLVVRDLVLVGLAFTNFVKTVIAIKSDAKILDLLSVDGFELQVQLVVCGSVRD
jgi:hypothetical protein